MTKSEFETKLTSVNSKISSITPGEAKSLKTAVLDDNLNLNNIKKTGIFLTYSGNTAISNAPFNGQVVVLNVNTEVSWQSGFQIAANYTDVAIRTFGIDHGDRRFTKWKTIYST